MAVGGKIVKQFYCAAADLKGLDSPLRLGNTNEKIARSGDL
jgi:hypothetical protein